MPKMIAAIFVEPNRIVIDDKPVPDVGPAGRADLGALVTHRFRLEDIEAACDLFANHRDGVLKVAITP